MNSYDQFVQYYEGEFHNQLEDVPFYREMARRTGDPILEMMCGSGRVLLPLAEDGWTVTGVDLSPMMLEVAHRKAAEAGLLPRTTLVQGDMRTVDLPAAHFSLAFVALNSFMHMEQVPDQLDALAAMRRTLMPGGILILDLFNPDLERLSTEDGRLLLEYQFELGERQIFKFASREVDLATQMMYVTYLYDDVAPSGQVTRRTLRLSLRWLYRYELEHLLARAGFTIISIFGAYDLSDYASHSDRLIIVASPQKELL
jgi:ubiquinone/menaquinone biosynthesis C-methylase UbiE